MHDFERVPQVLHPRLQRFLDYWLKKRGDRRMPTREDVDPTEIQPLLPGICLLDIHYQGEAVDRVRFRLAGTEIYEMAGFEVTGRFIDQIMPSERYAEVHRQFSWIVEHKEPVYRRFTWHASPVTGVVYERILAPLGPPEGRVSHFIGMHAIATDPDDRPLPQDTALPVG